MQAAGSTPTPAGPLYPLANGVHTFSNGSITVSDGNHVELVRTVGGASATYATGYPLSANGTSILSSSNVNAVSTPWFSVEAGDEVRLELKNFVSGNTSQNMNYIALRGVSGDVSTVYSTGSFQRKNGDKVFTGTIAESATVGSLIFRWVSFNSSVRFDIYLYINGVRYI